MRNLVSVVSSRQRKLRNRQQLPHIAATITGQCLHILFSINQLLSFLAFPGGVKDFGNNCMDRDSWILKSEFNASRHRKEDIFVVFWEVGVCFDVVDILCFLVTLLEIGRMKMRIMMKHPYRWLQSHVKSSKLCVKVRKKSNSIDWVVDLVVVEGKAIFQIRETMLENVPYLCIFVSLQQQLSLLISKSGKSILTVSVKKDPKQNEMMCAASVGIALRRRSGACFITQRRS